MKSPPSEPQASRPGRDRFQPERKVIRLLFAHGSMRSFTLQEGKGSEINNSNRSRLAHTALLLAPVVDGHPFASSTLARSRMAMLVLPSKKSVLIPRQNHHPSDSFGENLVG
jgi:hypothetical protein